MTELLLFRLFGPFASWGEVAVGEVRPSALRPTRSALLGILGAALGLDRRQDEDHFDLSASVALAVRIDSPGLPAVDYHTASYRHPDRKELIPTRADELGVARYRLSTVQSWRHYRADALYTVAVSTRSGSRYDLGSLREALLRPFFPLSLGRKSCVPALPLGPEIMTAATVLEAFDLYDQQRPACLPSWYPLRLNTMRTKRSVEIALDGDFGLPLGSLAEPQIFERRDEILSRRRWRFSARSESVFTLGRYAAKEEEVENVSQPPVAG